MIRLIKNSAEKTKIELIGDIGESFWGEGWTLDRFKNELETMDVGEIEIDIQSMGGDVLEAFAIHDAIRALPQKVTTRMVGSTASAGTVVAMAGDAREISPNSRFLIHNAWTVTAGDSEEHKIQEETLRSIDRQLIDIYRKVTGRTISDLTSQMKKGNWMSSKEALDWGFVQKLTEVKILNKSEMENKFLEILNVTTDEEAVDRVNALLDEVQTTKSERDALQARIDEYEAAEAQKQADTVKAYIDQAVTDKKITAESAEKWCALAQNDFEAVKATIDSIKPPESFKDFIDPKEGDKKLTAQEKFQQNWKAGEYKDDPERAARDFEAAYGKPLIIGGK